MDTDEALFERLIAGDMRAFDRLYDRFERPLFGFIRAQLGGGDGDGSDAEDVLHDTFMAVLRERHRRSEVRSVRAWLFTVARHLCLNRVRSHKRAARAVTTATHEQIMSNPPIPAEQALETRQQTERLARAVSDLPLPLAEVYRLRAAGMSLDEVAGVLEIPLGTVKSRVHEMVKRLRQEMQR